MMAWLMGLKNISPADLHQQMQQGQLFVFDVNSHASWRKSRVPGARHLDPVAYLDSDLPADKASSLVFYCSNPMCRKAPNAARRAKQLGYTNTQVMSAGISGWLAASLPIESGDISWFPRTSFVDEGLVRAERNGIGVSAVLHEEEGKQFNFMIYGNRRPESDKIDFVLHVPR